MREKINYLTGLGQYVCENCENYKNIICTARGGGGDVGKHPLNAKFKINEH
jgi:hypothetical protein